MWISVICETNGHELLNAQETDNIFTYKIKVGNQRGRNLLTEETRFINFSPSSGTMP